MFATQLDNVNVATQNSEHVPGNDSVTCS